MENHLLHLHLPGPLISVEVLEARVARRDQAVQKVVVLVLVDKVEGPVALADPAVQKVVVQALVDKAEVLVDPVDPAVQKVVVQKVVALRDNVTIRCAWSIMRWSSMPIRMASLIGTNCSSSLGTCLVLVIKALVDLVDLEVALRVEVQADPVAVAVDRAVLKVAQKVVAHNDRNAPNKLTTDNHVYAMSFPVQEKLERRMKQKSR